MTQRIEKVLSDQLNISRSEAKARIRQGQVTCNGQLVKSGGEKCAPERDALFCCGKKVEYRAFVYIMMNKPPGIISASRGGTEKTVIDLLPPEMRRKNLFPAGRLDKNTTGFMLITDDGDLAHRLLSPAGHIPKTYIAGLSAPFDETVQRAFEDGMELDGKRLMPAVLEPVNGDCRTARVVLRQGKYHQIKRMFARFGLEVQTLKRIQMGGLALDPALAPGDSRYMTAGEVAQLFSFC